MYDKFCSSWMICITNIIWQEESHIILPFHEGIIKISHLENALLAYNPKTCMIWKFLEMTGQWIEIQFQCQWKNFWRSPGCPASSLVSLQKENHGGVREAR